MKWYLTKTGRIVQGNEVLDRRKEAMGLIEVENPHKPAPAKKKTAKKIKTLED